MLLVDDLVLTDPDEVGQKKDLTNGENGQVWVKISTVTTLTASTQHTELMTMVQDGSQKKVNLLTVF